MKWKARILMAVYLVFLVFGLWFHTQNGLHSLDFFWTLNRDGWYQAPTGDGLRLTAPNEVELKLGSQNLKASIEWMKNELVRVEFSDGWAVETKTIPQVSVEVGGILLMHDLVYELIDMDAAGLSFAPAAEQVIHPFYDEEMRLVGESILTLSQTGETLDYQEHWFEQPEFNTPSRQTMVLKNGVRLAAEDLHNALFVNEAGEYLLEADGLAMMEMADAARSRGSLVYLISSVAEDKAESRGHPVMALPYTLLYWIGAFSFLFPQKAAFFGYRWMYQNEPELSEAGLFFVQVGGIIAMAGAVLLLLMA